MIRASARLRLWIVPLGCLVLLAVGTAQAEDTPPAKSTAQKLKPAKSIDEAIERGVAYLLENHKKEGYWGTPRRNMGIDIFAPLPGSQRSFQVAATGLALSGLVEIESADPKVKAAIEKATAWLVERYAVRRIRANTLYNTWAHMYALEAFARLLAREKNPEKRKVLMDAAQGCVKLLQRFEFVEGGWGYYNFTVKSKDPGQGATSWGLPLTTGQLKISVTANLGPEEVFIRTGTDARNQAGSGVVAFVSGAISERVISGPNGNRGWTTYEIPEPSAIMAASAGLFALFGCHQLVRRRSR